MKTTWKILGLVLMVAAIAIPAYAAGEAGVAPMGKTLAEFQNDFAGTKPVVAWHKYQDALRLKDAPTPTLSVSRMRVSPEDMTIDDFAAGTKPVAGWLKYNGPKQQPEAVESASKEISLSGTKPFVGALKG